MSAFLHHCPFLKTVSHSALRRSGLGLLSLANRCPVVIQQVATNATLAQKPKDSGEPTLHCMCGDLTERSLTFFNVHSVLQSFPSFTLIMVLVYYKIVVVLVFYVSHLVPVKFTFMHAYYCFNGSFHIHQPPTKVLRAPWPRLPASWLFPWQKAAPLCPPR